MSQQRHKEGSRCHTTPGSVCLAQCMHHASCGHCWVCTRGLPSLPPAAAEVTGHWGMQQPHKTPQTEHGSRRSRSDAMRHPRVRKGLLSRVQRARRITGPQSSPSSDRTTWSSSIRPSAARGRNTAHSRHAHPPAQGPETDTRSLHLQPNLNCT